MPDIQRGRRRHIIRRVRNSVVRRKRKYSISGSAMNQAENNESVMRRHIRYGLYDRMTTYIYQHNLTTQSHLLDRKSDLRHGLGWYCLEGGQNYTKQVNPNATEFKSTDFWHRLNATRQIKCTSLRYIAFNLPWVAFTLSGDQLDIVAGHRSIRRIMTGWGVFDKSWHFSWRVSTVMLHFSWRDFNKGTRFHRLSALRRGAFFFLSVDQAGR